jgi:hypothetical protein
MMSRSIRIVIALLTLADPPAWSAESSSPTARPSVPAHWSFVAPARPAEPQVSNPAWCRNPIDRFVLAALDANHIAPAPEAPKETLLRRLSLDLTGLPPTPAEIDAFLKDSSPDSYEKAVDRLLASPHYGERWARHWLDGARYADSNGYSIDAPRQIWKYRDWVIAATNRDMPFDQFTIEQIAGDLLPNATLDQKIATGFHRNTQINQEGGIDPEQFRVESVIDRVNTTGAVFLGLTIGCAQCHDHKFDPIKQKEYYQFFSFFNNCDEPELKVSNDRDAVREEQVLKQASDVEEELDRLLATDIKELSPAARAKLPAKTQAALDAALETRTKKQRDLIVSAFRASDKRVAALEKKIKTIRKQAAEGGTTTLVMQEARKPRETHLFVKGDFTRPAELVWPAVPAVLPQIDKPNPTRLDLAKWLVSPGNPLTARVTVNRMWQEYFGLGLVDTDNDFGTQGTLPSHPQLLDWLATELIRQHWSRKAIHRLIVTSATYRQSSRVRPELAASDPYNRLLARQRRLRLDAEIVRDVGLFSSGLLSDKVGGPSVFPPQPDGVMNTGQMHRPWKTSQGSDRYRRGMYTFLWRATPHPSLTSFDATNATATCTRRLRSNTPLQALILLNDDSELEFAQAMALRLMKEAPRDDDQKIDLAFRLCTGRQPSDDEKAVVLRLLKKESDAMAANPAQAQALAPTTRPAEISAQAVAPWTAVCRAMLNLDETITRE